MNIFGIGTDIVNIKRMEKSLRRNGDAFKKRIFSKNEIIYCERKKLRLKNILFISLCPTMNLGLKQRL